nr:hypothetical protein [Tanacetum cinerariifolium]
SADSAVTYSSVHFEARSWSIPFEDPYEGAAQQLLHHILQTPASLLPPRFLSPRIRPLSPRALGAEMNAIESSFYHSLHPSGTPPLPGCEVGESSAAAARRPGPTMAQGVNYSYVETRLRETERRMMAALELVNLRVSYQ